MVRHVHMGLSLGYVLNRMTQSTFFISDYFKIPFNIILPSTSRYFLFIFFRFSDLNFVSKQSFKKVTKKYKFYRLT